MFYYPLAVEYKQNEDKPVTRGEAVARAICTAVVLVAGVAVIILAALL